MAIRRLVIIVLLIAAVVGTAALQYSRAERAKQARIDDHKFIGTYVDLAIAREFYSDSPDSFRIVRDRIFSSRGTDSVWMEDHVKSFGKDSARRQNIWEEIVDSLQSMNKGPLPETIELFQSSSAVNADSM